MPILVECQCGKRFKAKDQAAGRTLACPGCGAPLTVPATLDARPAASVQSPVASSPRSEAPIRQPASIAGAYPGYPTRRNVPSPQADVRFSISGRMLALVIAAITIPTILFLVKIGPVRAMARWKEASPRVSSDITYVVEQAALRQLEAQNVEIKDARDVPQVRGLIIDEPIMMIRFPESVAFQGRFGIGIQPDFKGTYYPRTRRVVAVVNSVSIDAVVTEHGVKFSQ